MPDGEQQRDMRRFAGSCRFVYNKALAMQKENHEAGNKFIGYVTMAQCGYLEQAKSAAQRTFIPGTDPTGAGQDDVGAPVFLASAPSDASKQSPARSSFR